MAASATIDALKGRLGDLATSEFRGETRVVVPRESLIDALRLLRDERGFDLLVDITCVDYLAYRDATDRFGLVYLLANTATNERINVRVFLNEPELIVPTAVPLWEGANWLEREVWDLFGITFDGHPDHRRMSFRPTRCGRTIRCRGGASDTTFRAWQGRRRDDGDGLPGRP
jgi:NADH-quinone oxidoreductase subunit C